jgi:hypothetical protein
LNEDSEDIFRWKILHSEFRWRKVQMRLMKIQGKTILI